MASPTARTAPPNGPSGPPGPASSRTRLIPGLALRAGDVLGEYRLTSLLRADLASAFLAAASTTGEREVEIQVLIASADDIDAVRLRFLADARKAAAIHARSALRVLATGVVPEGQPYVVRELAHGETLTAAIERRGSLSTECAVDVALAIAEALEAAHAHGLVHGALGPQGVSIAWSGDSVRDVKLVDLGAAHAIAMLPLDARPRDTLAVAPPEHLESRRETDVRGDIFALGALVYTMIAGASPFASESPSMMNLAVAFDEPALLAGVPDGLGELVDACLARDPAQRPASMTVVASKLAAFGSQPVFEKRGSLLVVENVESDPLELSGDDLVDHDSQPRLEDPSAPSIDALVEMYGKKEASGIARIPVASSAPPLPKRASKPAPAKPPVPSVTPGQAVTKAAERDLELEELTSDHFVVAKSHDVSASDLASTSEGDVVDESPAATAKASEAATPPVEAVEAKTAEVEAAKPEAAKPATATGFTGDDEATAVRKVPEAVAARSAAPAEKPLARPNERAPAPKSSDRLVAARPAVTKKTLLPRIVKKTPVPSRSTLTPLGPLEPLVPRGEASSPRIPPAGESKLDLADEKTFPLTFAPLGPPIPAPPPTRPAPSVMRQLAANAPARPTLPPPQTPARGLYKGPSSSSKTLVAPISALINAVDSPDARPSRPRLTSEGALRSASAPPSDASSSSMPVEQEKTVPMVTAPPRPTTVAPVAFSMAPSAQRVSPSTVAPYAAPRRSRTVAYVAVASIGIGILIGAGSSRLSSHPTNASPAPPHAETPLTPPAPPQAPAPMTTTATPITAATDLPSPAVPVTDLRNAPATARPSRPVGAAAIAPASSGPPPVEVAAPAPVAAPPPPPPSHPPAPKAADDDLRRYLDDRR